MYENKIVENLKRYNTKYILNIALCFMFIQNNSIAQKADSLRMPSISAKVFIKDQKVILRWAPDNATVWQMGNKYGYIVERYTFLKNGKLTSDRNKITLTPNPIKPWNSEKWEKMADTSDFAAVAAQAIYGNDFDIDVNKATTMYSIFNKAKEIDSRYTFALHCANQSMDIASASALLFKDITSNASEAYLYRIYIPVPNNIMRIDTGKIFVEINKPYKLPKIRGVMSVTSGNGVIINWNSLRYERDYVSYIVERSDNGGQNFHPLSERPFVSLGNEHSAIPGTVIFLDSVPLYNFQYLYRVRGKSVFAEIGPPSDSIKVTALMKLFSCPSIKSFQIVQNKIVLTWEMPDNNKDAIKGFTIERASNPQSNYLQLNKTLLSPENRSFIDTIPISSNYYLVNAIDKEGKRHASLPYFIQLEDSISPLPPLGLKGTIDTSGIIHLIWKNNQEADILGYKIYRSYFRNAEFVQVSSKTGIKNTYNEKISLKNLNKYLYYKITAIDTHFNISGYSEIVKIKQPDVVAPSAPSISELEVTNHGITFNLIPSSSDDVDKYLIYRKIDQDSLWILQSVISSNKSQISYEDSTNIYGKIYTYNVIAIDSSGNESIPAKSVRCKALNQKSKNLLLLKLIIDLENKSIELKWNIESNYVSNILIYKAIDNEPISQYLNLQSNTNKFSDHNVKTQHKYKYMIKAIFLDNSESEFSKMEEISYE